MALFGERADTGLTIGRWLGKYHVYVESNEDRDVLEKWFADKLGDLVFLSADDGGGGGGGCSAVCDKVERSRQADIQAIGIVDRDALFNDKRWDLLWETDDAQFRAAQPYGPHVHVLLRWEMENYLLEPEALARVLKDAKHGQAVPTSVQIEQELQEHWQCVLPIMAACALLHEHGLQSPGHGYKADDTAEAITAELQTNFLPARFVGTSNWQAALARNEERLRNFEALGTFDVAAVLRIADGKRLLERIKVRHQIRYELRGFLSRAIRELGLIPEELQLLLDTLCNSHLPPTRAALP